MLNTWKLSAGGLELVEKASHIAADVIRANATSVDKTGSYPFAGLEALRSAGLLKLVSGKDVGGQGEGVRAAVAVADVVARECASTAMILIMHYSGSWVIEKHGRPELRRSIAEGKLTTLAFSESASGSQFWLPASTAVKTAQGIRLEAQKQLITSAGKCDVYVWSSRPMAAEGLSTIWAVPAATPGLSIPAPYDGLGLRGNSSAPITAKDALVPEANRLGADGKGFDVMMSDVLPLFSLQSCAVSLGIMEGALERTVAHVTRPRYSHDGSRIADFPQARAHVARIRVIIDLVRGFLLDALDALDAGREDAMLRVLESKIVGGESSLEALDLAMRVCGGAGFRKEVGVERYFRDGRAASVMAPVPDALYDFIGKAVCGMPLFG